MPGLTLDEWGPSFWNTIHVLAHTSPHSMTDTQAKEYTSFIFFIAHKIPCPKCKLHFLTFLEKRKSLLLGMRKRSIFVSVMNDAHNEVNKRTGKRVFSLEEHYSMYSLVKKRKPFHRRAILSSQFLAAIALLVLVVLASKRK